MKEPDRNIKNVLEAFGYFRGIRGREWGRAKIAGLFILKEFY
jgi:hypothetical protein